MSYLLEMGRRKHSLVFLTSLAPLTAAQKLPLRHPAGMVCPLVV